MQKLKSVLNSPAAVICCNIIITAVVCLILMTEFLASIILMALAVAGVLMLDKYRIINAMFDAYNSNKKAAIISGIALAILIPILLTDQNYIAHIATTAVIYAIACLGLNFQMGSTDMTNFAPAAFMGIGAYAVAICTVYANMSPWIGLVIGVVFSAVFGIIIGIPTLKTKGYYLSLVTMAIQIAFTQLITVIPAIGGSNGIPGVGRFTLFGLELYKRYTVFGIRFAPQIPYLLFCIAVLILLTYVAMRVYHTKHGLSLNTIAQDDIAANCMGINVSRQKLFAFVIGGVFCGISGSLFAGLDSYVGPDSYNFSKSLMLICMVILGGMDNSVGIITGAFLLSIVSEKLRDSADYQQLVYGLILVIMLIVRPDGIIPKRVRDYCGITRREIVRSPMPIDVPEAFAASTD